MAVRLRTILVDGLQAANPTEIPAMPSEPMDIRRRHMVGATIGGAVGGILGFLIGFGLFIPLILATSRWPGEILLACFFAPRSGSRWADRWAWIGSYLTRRFNCLCRTRANQPTQNNPWASLGAVAGFIGGGAVGLSLLALIDSWIGPGRMPIWIVVPVFFACPISGLFAGRLPEPVCKPAGQTGVQGEATQTKKPDCKTEVTKNTYSFRYITNASTSPRVGCEKAPGRVPTTSKPRRCQS